MYNLRHSNGAWGSTGRVGGKKWALGTPWGRGWGTSQSVIRNGLVEGRNGLSWVLQRKNIEINMVHSTEVITSIGSVYVNTVLLFEVVNSE